MTIAVIIAKGNSNRIPGKNMRDFCGKPLFMWSVEQAIWSKKLDRVFVSSDSKQILDLAWPFCEVIPRPHEYTLTPANQALQHSIVWLEKKGIQAKDQVCLLPTSPIRLPWDIDNMIKMHKKHGQHTTATVCEQLETIIYKYLPNGQMTPLLWDKTGRYYCDGGGMNIQNVAWFKGWKVPETDAKYDQAVYDGTITLADEHKLIMKEWQTPELDLPDHWDIAEAIMEKCLLQPLGRDCYEKYYNSQGEENGN